MSIPPRSARLPNNQQYYAPGYPQQNYPQQPFQNGPPLPQRSNYQQPNYNQMQQGPNLPPRGSFPQQGVANPMARIAELEGILDNISRELNAEKQANVDLDFALRDALKKLQDKDQAENQEDVKQLEEMLSWTENRVKELENELATRSSAPIVDNQSAEKDQKISELEFKLNDVQAIAMREKEQLESKIQLIEQGFLEQKNELEDVRKKYKEIDSAKSVEYESRIASLENMLDLEQKKLADYENTKAVEIASLREKLDQNQASNFAVSDQMKQENMQLQDLVEKLQNENLNLVKIQQDLAERPTRHDFEDIICKLTDATQTNESLGKKIADYEKNVFEKENAIQASQRQLEDMSSEIAKYSASISQYEDAISKLESSKKELEEDAAIYEKQILEQSSKLDEKQQMIERLEYERDAPNDAVQILERTLENAQQSNRDLQKTMVDLQQELSKSKAEGSNLREKLEAHLANSAKSDAELNDKTNELQTLLDAKTAFIGELERKLKDNEQELKTLTADFLQSKNMCNNLEDNMEKLKMDLRDSKTTIENISEKFAAANELEAKLQRELSNSITSYQTLEQRNATLENKLSEALHQLDEMNSRIHEAESKDRMNCQIISEKDATIARLEHARDAPNEAVSILENNLKEMHLAHNELQMKADALEYELKKSKESEFNLKNEYEQSITTVKKDLSASLDINKSLKSELATLNDQIISKEKTGALSTEQMRNHISQLENELSMIKSGNQSLEKASLGFEAQIEQLSKKLVERDAKIEELMRENLKFKNTPVHDRHDSKTELDTADGDALGDALQKILTLTEKLANTEAILGKTKAELTSKSEQFEVLAKTLKELDEEAAGTTYSWW